MLNTHSQEPDSASSGLLKTGLLRLDELLHGGFPSGSLVAITGLPGSGKTILTLQVLAHLAQKGYKSVYFSTSPQPPTKFTEYYGDFAFFKQAGVSERLAFEDLSSSIRKGNLSEVLNSTVRRVQESGPKAIAIDSFRHLRDLATSRAQLWEFLDELRNELSKTSCTTFLVGQYVLPQDMDLPDFAMADIVLYLEVERLVRSDQRAMRIYKNRGKSYEEGRHAFSISNNGIRFAGEMSGL